MTDLAVLVGQERSDPLIAPLLRALGGQGFDVEVVEPGRLATCPLSATAEDVTLAGAAISVAVYRAMAEWSLADSFCEDDRSFASNEVRAVWLHALSLPSVRSVNRSDPQTWFALSEWPTWRSRFKAAGVSMAPLVVGDAEQPRPRRWLHWGGGDAAIPSHTIVRRSFATASLSTSGLAWSLFCCGEVIDGPSLPAVEEAGRVFETFGVVLGGILTDDAGRVAAATSQPSIAPGSADRAAAVLAAHLSR